MGAIVFAPAGADATYELRRVVLRNGDASRVTFPEDEQPGTVHLVGHDGDEIVAAATLVVAACPVAPDQRALQLRGMAVAPSRQGQGIGRRLLERVVEEAGAQDAEILWANARDSALGFYEQSGMRVLGDGFATIDTGLPHHLVVLDLTTGTTPVA
jgi:GNAT superfamily N-acetyltransferase